jgi:hypothetical protein
MWDFGIREVARRSAGWWNDELGASWGRRDCRIRPSLLDLHGFGATFRAMVSAERAGRPADRLRSRGIRDIACGFEGQDVGRIVPHDLDGTACPHPPSTGARERRSRPAGALMRSVRSRVRASSWRSSRRSIVGTPKGRGRAGDWRDRDAPGVWIGGRGRPKPGPKVASLPARSRPVVRGAPRLRGGDEATAAPRARPTDASPFDHCPNTRESARLQAPRSRPAPQPP